MTSSNPTRGQLRPHFAGRSPPFLVVGLFLGLFILGFSYWSLSSQYKDLCLQYEEMKNQYQINSQKRETAEKQNDMLQQRLQSQNEELGKMKTSIDKKEQELSQLAQQLRNKDEEVSKAHSQYKLLKDELDNHMKTNEEKDMQISTLKDQLQKLEIENDKLKKLQKELEVNLTALRSEIEQLKEARQSKNSIDAAIGVSGSVADHHEENKPLLLQPNESEQANKNANIIAQSISTAENKSLPLVKRLEDGETG